MEVVTTRTVHRAVATTVGMLALLAGVLVIPAAASPDSPIVGTWTHSSGGVVQIVASGSTSYVGTVTSPINFGSCVHPVGEKIWTLNDTQYGNEFSGTHVMCNGSSGTALARLDDIDNAATPTLRLDLYVNGTSSGELRRPGSLMSSPTPTPTPSATPSPGAQAVPTIVTRVPSSILKQGSGGWVTVPIQVRISGNKDDWLNWQIDIYDNSGRVVKAVTDQFRHESGIGRTALRLRPREAQSGPFYACAWGMTDAGGVRTANAPRSSCAFLRVQQAPYLWADWRNCAPMYTTDSTKWMLGTRYYGGKPVPFWRACAIRDSGYLGMVVRDPRAGTWYDFREWSRSEVDSLFLRLLRRECRVALRKVPDAALRACLGGIASNGSAPASAYGAYTYYTAARAIGAPFFDVNLAQGGTQSTPDFAAVPAGGQRTND